jgi:hypothetical protein
MKTIGIVGGSAWILTFACYTGLRLPGAVRYLSARSKDLASILKKYDLAARSPREVIVLQA